MAATEPSRESDETPDPALAPQSQWQPTAAIATWILPGLGHALLGHRVRGLILCTAIMGLWLLGLVLAGVGSINHQPAVDQFDAQSQSRGVRWWFVGQVMVAPTLVVNAVRHRLDSGERPLPAWPGEPDPPYEPAIGHMDEQGVLFTTIAGLLNLLCIIDVLYCDPRRMGQALPGLEPG